MTDQHINNNKSNIFLIAVLLTGAFITILNQTLLGTALPPIMEDLNLTESTAQWLQSIFMLVNGIMIPVTAFLIEKFTTRRLFLTALSLFAFGTFIAAISPGFTILLIGRIFQAAGAGIMMPLLQTIMFIIFPIERRGTAMNNTFRQVAGAIGTAILVTIMTTTALPGEGINGLIHGVNISFIVAGIISLIGFFLSLTVKQTEKQVEG